MEKETIIARLKGSISFTEATQSWISRYRPDSWIAKEEGQMFFQEFSQSWNHIFVESCESDIRDYFKQLGVPEQYLPKVKISETYTGSWYIEAVLTMSGTVGTIYVILKGISELPKIADGLSDLKNRIKKKFAKKANETVSARIAQGEQKQLPPPPSNAVNTDFVIDARPLTALAAEPLHSHKIHLSVAVSRHTFTLENLNSEPLQNVQIGIFKSDTQRNQWSYADSYGGTIPFLSGCQTIVRDVSEFKHTSQGDLDLSGTKPIHVDCWVQDQHGIYLFMFYLDK